MGDYDHLKRPPNRLIPVTGPMNKKYAFPPMKRNSLAYIVLWILICILSIDFIIHITKPATDEQEEQITDPVNRRQDSIRETRPSKGL